MSIKKGKEGGGGEWKTLTKPYTEREKTLQMFDKGPKNA